MAPSSGVVKENVRKIHDIIETLERGNPNATIIVLGDFNSAYVQLPHFYQQVTCSTRGDKILDKCYINIKNSYKTIKLPELGNSDHASVYLLPTYKHKATISQSLTVNKRIWNEDNMNKLLSCLDDTNWAELLSAPDINDATDTFVDYLNFSIDTCIPSKNVTVPANNKTWMTPRINRLTEERIRAFQTNSADHRQIKGKLQKAIREAKHNHASDIESKMQSNSRLAWNQLKSILKLKESAKGCSLDSDVLNAFFNRFDKQSDIPFLPCAVPVFEDFSFEEVYATLCAVKVNKSPGPDNITGRLLKAAAPTLAYPLTLIFNRSLQQGVMPQVWKTASIKPIPKFTGASEPKDFRPIALTSIVGKCLERLVMKRVAPLLDDPTQFAYKPQRSTEDALISLIDTVTAHLDSNAKNTVRALFIDFSSAFNTINPKILIDKLVCYDLHPNILNWIYDFLTNRKQRVITSLNTSDSLSTSTGSPQGCVISPLLFSMYVVDMPTVNNNIQLVKYADDTVIMELLSDKQPSQLQMVADTVNNWCAENDLVLNAKKTKEMIMQNARDNPSYPMLHLNNSDIEQVDQFTYLGTIVTSKLDFTLNTTKTAKKARKRLHIVSKLYHLGLTEKLIHTCYKSFIESVLTYHQVVIYKHMTADSKKKLNSVVKSAEFLSGDLSFTPLADLYTNKLKVKSLRMVATNSEPLLELSQLPSGRYQAVKHRVQIRARCFRAECVRYLNSIFHK